MRYFYKKFNSLKDVLRFSRKERNNAVLQYPIDTAMLKIKTEKKLSSI